MPALPPRSIRPRLLAARLAARCALAALTVLPAFAALPALAAQADDWLLSSSDPRTEPGKAFEVVLIAPEGPAEWRERFPAQLELPGGARIAVELIAMSPDATAPRRRYMGHWPMEVQGVATLSLRDVASGRLILDASAPPTPATLAAASLEAPALALAADVAPQDAAVEPAEPGALGFNEPMYFVVGGRDPRSARFQISFRYRLFDSRSVIAETLPLARGLYFGFTQTSMWDLSSDSKPFRDTSFRPSFFYQWKLSDPKNTSSLALAAGYEHESNGRDEEDSRSIDTLFLQADARHYFGDSPLYLGITPKLWHYLDKDENPDIARYRGYGQLGVRFGRDDGLMLAAQLRRGTAGKSGTQLDLSYPLRRSIFSGVGAFVHLQYFHGYGETLLDYNQSSKPQFRIGLSVVR